MTNDKAIEGTNVTAFQMGEFWNQVGAGLINRQAMQLFLERRNPFMTEVWRTITIGNIATVDELLKQLEQEVKLYEPMNEQCVATIRRPDFKLSNTVQEVDLVAVTGKDMGFTERHSEPAMIARAEKFGLELCPAEVGPQLRLQYHERCAEQTNIAMKRLGKRFIFQLKGERSYHVIYSHDGSPDYTVTRWPVEYRWVFVKPRK